MSCACLRRLERELARPTLFDEGTEAARNACVAGAPLAAASITASAYYDNPLAGTRALVECLELVTRLPLELEAWLGALRPRVHPETGDSGYVPGFGYVSSVQAECVAVAARRLARARRCRVHHALDFYLRRREQLTTVAGALNPAGLTALVCADHGTSADATERTFLLARVGVALDEAARARRRGVARFPFFTEAYVYEGDYPPRRTLDYAAARRGVGL